MQIAPKPPASKFMSHALFGQRLYFAIVVALLLVARGLAGESDLDALRTDLQTRWKAYESVSSALQGKVVVKDYDMLRGGGIRQHYWSDYSYNGANGNTCVINQEEYEPNTIGNCYGINDRYAFVLNRKSLRDPWVLKQIFSNPEYRKQEPFYGIVERAVSKGPFFLYQAHLSDLITDPKFEIRSQKIVEINGISALRIDFAYAGKPAKRLIEREGWVILNLDEYRTVRSFEAKAIWSPNDQAIVKGELELGKDNCGNPVWRKNVVEIIRDSGREPIHLKIVRECDFAAELPRPERFYLPFYGLPEPAGLDRGRIHSLLNSWLFWCVCAIVVCIAFGIGFRRWQNHRP